MHTNSMRLYSAIATDMIELVYSPPGRRTNRPHTGNELLGQGTTDTLPTKIGVGRHQPNARPLLGSGASPVSVAWRIEGHRTGQASLVLGHYQLALVEAAPDIDDVRMISLP